MSRLTEALDLIGNYLQQHAPEVFAALQPGLSYEEIEEIVKDLPVRLPPEVYELYQWRNGSESSPYGFRVFKDKGDYDYGWYSLQHVVNHYNENGFHWYYSTRALEIFFSVPHGSGYISIDPEKITCPVILGIYSDSCSYHYTSLTNMMLTIAECYETGAYNKEAVRDLSQPDLETNKIWWKYNYDIKDILLEKLQTKLSWLLLAEMKHDLVRFQDSRAVDILIQRLQTTASETTDAKMIRQETAEILGRIGDVKAVEPLIRALQDEDEGVRSEVTIALGMLKDERAIKPLIHALEKDKESQVLLPSTIAGALIELRAVEPLIEILHHKNLYVRLQAACALGRIGDKRAVEPLSQLLADADSDVRETVREALEAIDLTS